MIEFIANILDMKKYIIIIALILIGGVAYFYRANSYDTIQVDLPVEKNYNDFLLNQNNENINQPKPVAEKPTVTTIQDNNQNNNEYTAQEGTDNQADNQLAASINLDVPFTSQAPTGNWDEPFQNACEEASVLMVDYYYQGKTMPSKQEVEGILVDMVNWQIDNWGGHFNLPVSKLAEYVTATFGYKTEVVQNITVAKIKEFLNQGIPVIVPADGRKLDNPFFTGEGPEYHMLVIKGYIDDKFITDDPGTRRGEDFIYTQDNLMYSIADWDSKKGQAVGPKNALVLYKN